MKITNLTYKIFALIFASIAIIVAGILFSQIAETALHNNLTFYLAGIIFPVLFLTGIVFLQTTQNSREKKKNFTVVESNISQDDEELLENAQMTDIKPELINDFTGKIIGKQTIVQFSEALLKTFAQNYSIVQGIVFTFDKNDEKYNQTANYAFYSNEEIRPFALGEGISGQVAKNQEILHITNIPENYITVLSGLGSSSPKHLMIIPLVFENKTIAIVELAAFSDFPESISQVYAQINEPLAKEYNRFLSN